ncbi:DUF6705 family protein [Chryseobacterium sp. GP-SGM7]|uniref:DUF6705 family protein n=1 Tax=Chryseobacterium sp. GP-SGM7 TaxID=3411323 RepID=UPI003B93C64D
MKIKILLLSVIFIFSCLQNCNAQNVTYHHDPDADKFVGTWKWGDTANGLTLIMKKENGVSLLKSGNYIDDTIIGFHKIYKNGQITEDKTIYSTTNFIDGKKSFVAGTENNDPNLLVVFMSHKNKNIIMKILYIDPTHIKIVEVKNQEGARFIKPGQTPTDWSIDIPNNIVLTKQ